MKRSFDLITMPVTPVERRQEERLAAFYEALKPTRPDLKIPASLDLVIQKFLLRHEARPLREDAPRILVVQAGPGVGKSHACIDVPLRRGWNVISEGSSTFLGETEMSGSAPYKAMFVNAEKIAHATGVRTCCVVHDFDLILGAERGEVRGPSHRVIAECTQYIASNKSLYCNVDGSCIPLLVNGNNFTGVRSSVFRDQRAHWETVEITLPEKIDMVQHLFRTVTETDKAALAAFVTSNSDEAVSFFVALKSGLETERFNDILLGGEQSMEHIEAVFAKGLAIDPQALAAAAARLHANRAADFIKSTL